MRIEFYSVGGQGRENLPTYTICSEIQADTPTGLDTGDRLLLTVAELGAAGLLGRIYFSLFESVMLLRV
jgi:hypothetical protein